MHSISKSKYSSMEGVLILHEALNNIKNKKQSDMLLKIDFEKAYDKIKWSFLFQILRMKGFPDKWIDWVMETIRGGKFVSRLMRT